MKSVPPGWSVACEYDDAIDSIASLYVRRLNGLVDIDSAIETLEYLLLCRCPSHRTVQPSDESGRPSSRDVLEEVKLHGDDDACTHMYGFGK